MTIAADDFTPTQAKRWVAREAAKYDTLEMIQAMMVGNHDRSDIMTDYFDVGWYIDLSIGEWNKPYALK